MVRAPNGGPPTHAGAGQGSSPDDSDAPDVNPCNGLNQYNPH